MRVAVQTDFMTGIADHGAFFGKALEGVSGDEPGAFYVVFLEEPEESTGSNCTGEDT